ncbi:Uncharacterized protein HZ326_10411 [Fusarium oxysporum f. sp. albedinis]|nr:Uncharacterized protein HZ326_10411 [Fusarium oxysporum f. sp. albedinis]
MLARYASIYYELYLQHMRNSTRPGLPCYGQVLGSFRRIFPEINNMIDQVPHQHHKRPTRIIMVTVA